MRKVSTTNMAMVPHVLPQKDLWPCIQIIEYGGKEDIYTFKGLLKTGFTSMFIVRDSHHIMSPIHITSCPQFHLTEDKWDIHSKWSAKSGSPHGKSTLQWVHSCSFIHL